MKNTQVGFVNLIDRMMSKKLILVLWPYTFRDFDWERIELDQLSNSCDVKIHELIGVSTPFFSKAYSAKSQRSEIIRYRSLVHWVFDIVGLVARCGRANLVILDFFDFQRKFIPLIIKFFAVFLGVKVVNFSLAGIATEPRSLKYRNAHRSSKGIKRQLKYHLESMVKRLYFSMLGRRGHILSAGSISEYHKSTLKNRLNVAVHEASSWDCSNLLIEKRSTDRRVEGRYAVLLDGAGPMHLSDSLLLNHINPLTIENWYPALCKFFDYLEANYVDTVVIAAHPMVVESEYPNHFNQRRCFNTSSDRNITRQLVANSEFVITRQSTAISYAIIYRKPILFVTSEELLTCPQFAKTSLPIYKALGKVPLNIDNYIDKYIDDQLVVDSDNYRNYEKKFLSSSKGRSNSEIVLSDIIRF